MIILTTPRLVLREYTPADAPFIFRLVNDPSWLKYIGDRHVYTIDDAEAYIRNGAMKSYEVHGYGSWLAELVSTGEAIGACGLMKRDFLPDPDLGFAFLPEFTGKGYAQEAAQAVLRYATDMLGMTRLGAYATNDNDRSIRLLEKLGFTYSGPLIVDGEELALFLYMG